MKVIVDTNVLIRIVVHDDPDQAHAAEDLMQSASTIVISTSCLCELVWVLRKTYGLGNASIAHVLRTLLDTSKVELDRPTVEAGLRLLEAGGDFADGAIASEGVTLGGQVFASFDKKAVVKLADQGFRTLHLV